MSEVKGQKSGDDFIYYVGKRREENECDICKGVSG